MLTSACICRAATGNRARLPQELKSLESGSTVLGWHSNADVNQFEKMFRSVVSLNNSRQFILRYDESVMVMLCKATALKLAHATGNVISHISS